ncbi:PAS domain S-box protein [Roseofilum capinflatum]|uniref:histidine kinase n=1 Tax=Roseofilum capinflatum BLCC-M114 TaxID=3022440 RepID=A0ABT7BC11_9CYAN|nr:PAS domain S-box protein [Roseofilum capinflatum]MDJ1176730.1 PAS domain S-box protein [Roseofilum capinflatum BLCC-M114]
MDSPNPTLELLQLFVEQTPAAVALFDRQMRYLLTSDRWLTDYGLRDTPLNNLTFYDTFPQCPEQWKPIHQECLLGNYEGCEEHYFFGADGKLQWVEWDIRPWRTPSGEINGLMMFTKNITKRKRAEAAWMKIENRFNKLTANVPGIICQLILKPEHPIQFTYVSLGCTKICELDPDDLQQQPHLFEDLIHPDDRLEYKASINRAIQNRSSWFWEGRIITQSGEIKWLACSTSPPDEQHSIEQQFLDDLPYDVTPNELILDGLFIEVTERKQAELSLLQQETQLTALFKAMTDLILVLDREGHILEVAPTNSKLLAHDRVELYGMKVNDLMPAQNSNLLLANLRRSLETQKTIDVEYSIILDDQTFWLAAKVSPLDMDTVVWVARDITRRKESEGKLEQYRDSLEERVEQRTAELEAEVKERQQIEQALRQHVQMLDLANDSIMILNLDGTIKYWNHGAHKLYGWTKQQALNQNIHTLLQTEFSTPLPTIHQVLEQHGYWEGELQQTKRDGTAVTVASRWTLQRNEQGDPVALLEINNDITYRFETEMALRKSEELYRTLAQNFPDGAVVLFDLNLRFTLAEGRELGKLRLGKEQLEGSTPAEVFPSSVSQLMEYHYQNALAGQTEQFEVALGDHFYLFQTLPVRNDEGQIMAGMALMQNITQRKRSEEAIRKSEARYREMAQREELINRLASQVRNSLNLNQILEIAVVEIQNLLRVDQCWFGWYQSQGIEEKQTPEASPHGYLNVVQEAKTETLPSVLGCFPVQADDPLLSNLLNLEMLQVDDVFSHQDLGIHQLYDSRGYRAILFLPIKTAYGELGCVSCAHFDGPRRWTEDEVELLQTVTDQLAIAISQAELYRQATLAAENADRKATELEETLRQLQRTQAQLIQSEKLSSLGQMVAGVAHEINNPVNFIYGNLVPARDYTADILGLLQLYQETYPEPAELIEEEIEAIDLEFISDDLPRLLDSMQVGAERIREIVLSLRNFSRLDEAEMKKVDLHEGIDSTLMILQNRLKAKGDRPGVEVSKNYGQLPKINCYPGQLNQVFMNLLSNAIDALEEHSIPEPKITITTELINNNQAIIRLADNGPGVPEKVRQRLFDPFFTTKPVGKGTGLGLAISYQIIVEKHQGQLSCISEVGQGATFMIQIPVVSR